MEKQWFNRLARQLATGTSRRRVLGGLAGAAVGGLGLRRAGARSSQGDGEPCNQVTCGAGEFCCNFSCSICAPVGGACTEQFCGEPCNAVVCGPEEYCCNFSCSICAPVGGACTQEFCGEPCNQVTCGAGEFCCNFSCSICAPVGGACTQEFCGDPCAAQGLTDCGGECVDLSSDLRHCGACGNVCESGLVAVACVAGECVRTDCPAALTDCGAYCADLATDPDNCGACGNVCQGGVCANGACVDPATEVPTAAPTAEPTATARPAATATTPPRATATTAPTGATSTPTGAQCPATSEDANEAIARRWYEDALNRGDVDALDELLAADVVHHAATFEDARGVDAVRRVHRAILAGFPDVRYRIEQAITEGDLVVIRWAATGTHEGEFQGIEPTTREVTWTGINIFRVACGRVAEVWSEVDGLGRLQQLGALPTPTPTP